MKIFEVCTVLEKYAPLSLAEDYDNVGLLLGDKNSEVTGILTTLDVDMEVAIEAVSCGANLIVSHHPIMFSPIKKITDATPEGRLLLFLIQNNIAVYASHTNLDAAEGGLNDLIAGFLKLSDIVPLREYSEGGGIGRVGTLPHPMPLRSLVAAVCEIFSLNFVRHTGDVHRPVSRVAICSGGGGSLTEDAINANADVYITGDLKYNGVRDAAQEGLDIIEVGHFASECFAKRLLAEIITDALGTAVPVSISNSNTDVFTTYGG